MSEKQDKIMLVEAITDIFWVAGLDIQIFHKGQNIERFVWNKYPGLDY